MQYFADASYVRDDGYGTEIVVVHAAPTLATEYAAHAQSFEGFCQRWRVANGDPDGLCNVLFADATV